MSELTRKRIEEILAGCEGVTPGPWDVGSWRDNIFSVVDGEWAPICRVKRNDDEATDNNQDVVDAAHIARLDPFTVRALCTLALRAEKYREALKPFAEATMADPNHRDKVADSEVYAQGIKFGDYRRARAAYEE